ncbi:hypothetical protein PTSG_03144 [Salpingoeca rosetta]|uniref:WSC domain-containing protein n=1 Tax=Salpingoeca rosetta (strain ATCC 50818 / BSB-021) TaxID=946362 RepID=F2U4D0_SALR5|nr:uncharacterized protein PTSG_03144 [Salpingoeca rosetta]EGD82496.1 hypothetical protein PTSG_03144 [Salpingoeca rosetta]|eukprot:XP_004995732.1 hypothetical protein PTSG_03144 [Salpingoeca rosetta]
MAGKAVLLVVVLAVLSCVPHNARTAAMPDFDQIKATLHGQIMADAESMLPPPTSTSTTTTTTTSTTTSAYPSMDSENRVLLRGRRTLEDIVSIEKLEPVRRYVPASRLTDFVNVDSVADFFPTTRAQDFTFFRLTNANAGNASTILNTDVPRNACIAVASAERCVDSTCTSLSKNDVPQRVYSWQPVTQAWTDAGPGAAVEAGTGVITGNGIVGLTHFSPDKEQDMIIPASFSSDITSTNFRPFEQCGDVWRYQGEGQGYHKYLDCAWTTHGARHVEHFAINGEHFILQTNMVKRQYFLGQVVSETFTSVPNFILKWSARTTDNQGQEQQHGFFLTGGEQTNGTLSPDDAAYNENIGNNGANVWQVFGSLSGVVHAKVFDIRGETFLAFAEYVSDKACTSLDAQSVFPSCWDVEISSHVFKYDPRSDNPRGDCIAPGNPAGCQEFQGEFKPYQTLRTVGARHIEAFSVSTTGSVQHFLAVAESHDNGLETASSTIYRWNGYRFGVFQKLDTLFAEKFEFFEIEGQAHLAVTNRGCPPLERNTSFAACGTADSANVGRTQVYYYDVFTDEFRLLKETAELGELHAYGSSTNEDGALVLENGGQGPVGLAVFQLPRFELVRFTETVTYVAVANARILETNTVGSCPNTSPVLCSRPENLFRLRSTVTMGIANSVTQVSQQAVETELQLSALATQVNGGEGLTSSLVREYGLDLRLYGASSSVDVNIGGEQYVIVGFEEAYMTAEECVDMYVNRSSPAYACGHLNTDSSIATEAQCASTCDQSSSTYDPVVRNHRTETIVFRVARGTTRPRLQEVQRLPSLGVSALHVFQTEANVTQEVFDACASAMNPADCIDAATAGTGGETVLAVVNAKSTCEHSLVDDAPLSPDPAKAVTLYVFSTSSKKFVERGRVHTMCEPASITTFTTECQRTSGTHFAAPACAQYMALAEDCTAYNEYLVARGQNDTDHLIPGNHRISFHRLMEHGTLTYMHCQPYPDPGDERNHAESPCYQSPDRFRQAGVADAGDEHAYDFPDLLPTSAVLGQDITEDGTGYFPRLRATPVASITAGISRARKNIFYRNDRGTEEAIPVNDLDGQSMSPYWLNGRKRFEVLLSVSYDRRRAAPQVFGLRALHPRSRACAGRHATTPRRRAFEVAQAMSGAITSGGTQSVFFERQTLDGSTRSYAVFAERHTRTTTDTDADAPAGYLSSVYVDSACHEYTKFDSTDPDVSSGGIFAPAVDILPGVTLPANDTEWCPYSTHVDHFLAWEAFENHYHPVSPCKGRSYNPDGPTYGVYQRFYNRLPPASIRAPLSETVTATPRAGFAYPRLPDEVQILPSFQFSTADYVELFNRKDEVMGKLQDLATYQANAVEAVEVCGSSSQLWLVFGNDGWDVQYNSEGLPVGGITPPVQKRYLYRWNENYAVASDGRTCSAAAAREELALYGTAYAQLGCFEAVELSVPVNSGRAIAVSMFSAYGWLVMLQINAAEGQAEDPAPALCKADTTANSPAGVSSYSAVVDLATYGGSSCRVHVQEEAATITRLELEDRVAETVSQTMNAIAEVMQVALNSTAPLNYTALDERYVTLNTDQEITGTKTFSVLSADAAIISNDLAVEGELDVAGTATIGENLDVFGTVDGVDVSVFNEQVRVDAEDTALKLLELTELSCTLSADVDSLNSNVFGTSAAGAVQCVGVVKETQCYPKDSLKTDGFGGLFADVRRVVEGQLAPLALNVEVDSVRMFPKNTRAYLVLKAFSASNLTAAQAAVDLATYFSPLYCQADTSASAQVGYTLVTQAVRFVLVSCDLWSQDVLNELKLALVTSLSEYAVRATDIDTPTIVCNTDGSSRLDVQVKAANAYSADVAAALDSQPLWTDTYLSLVQALPSLFANVADVVEYSLDNYAPPDSAITTSDDDFSGDIMP